MRWASVVNVILGAWLILAPWGLWYYADAAVANSIVVGAAIVIASVRSARIPTSHTGAAWLTLVLGAWLLLAPWVLGYIGTSADATGNDWLVGILTVAFAGARIGTARRVARVT